MLPPITRAWRLVPFHALVIVSLLLFIVSPPFVVLQIIPNFWDCEERLAPRDLARQADCTLDSLFLWTGFSYLNEADGDKCQYKGREREPEGILHREVQTLLALQIQSSVRNRSDLMGQGADMYTGPVLGERS